MRKTMWVFLFTIIFVEPTQAQLRIPGGPLTDTVATTPFIANRLFPAELLHARQSAEIPGVPANVFVMAARNATWLKPTLDSLGLTNSTSFSDIYNAVCATPYSHADLARTGVHLFRVETARGAMELDANFLAYYPKTELASCEPPRTYDRMWNGQVVQWVPFRGDSYETLAATYSTATTFKAAPEHWRSYESYHYNSLQLWDTPSLWYASTVETGDVSFGRPMVWTAAEAGLQLPISIAQSYDVYVVVFAMSALPTRPTEVDEITFYVKPTSEAIALDLVPLRFEAATSEQRGRSVNVQLSAGIVTFGTTFKQDVAVEGARPVIVAHGLQEASFGWTVRDAALSAGSTRFVAVIGVPRGRASLSFDLAATTKYKGRPFINGSVSKTQPSTVPVRLMPGAR